ncbi:MAG: hypothetical protein LAP38_13110 [Acidobacteriia bacterium]|nr:hypothetical protein [Terriglobia bacterium]
MVFHEDPPREPQALILNPGIGQYKGRAGRPGFCRLQRVFEPKLSDVEIAEIEYRFAALKLPGERGRGVRAYFVLSFRFHLASAAQDVRRGLGAFVSTHVLTAG